MSIECSVLVELGRLSDELLIVDQPFPTCHDEWVYFKTDDVATFIERMHYMNALQVLKDHDQPPPPSLKLFRCTAQKFYRK